MRQYASKFEDLLKTEYSVPQVTSIPDEADPNIPRIIFGSTHGFSQIIISQISIRFGVMYDEQMMHDRTKIADYLKGKVPTVFRIISEVLPPKAQPIFAGLATKTLVTAQDTTSEGIVTHLRNRLGGFDYIDNIFDLQRKVTTVVDEKYFSNITIANYRLWGMDEPSTTPALSDENLLEMGIDIEGDFNDRYSYNRDSGYRTNPTVANTLIDRGLGVIQDQLDSLLQ